MNNYNEILKEYADEVHKNLKLVDLLISYKEKLDKIKSICETWNYYLPDEALEELKEILNE